MEPKDLSHPNLVTNLNCHPVDLEKVKNFATEKQNVFISYSLEVLLCDVSAARSDAGDGSADADVPLEAHHDGAVHRRHHGDLK